MGGTEKKRILTHFAQQGLRQSFVRARDTAARGSFYRITRFYYESRPDRNVIMIPQQFQVQILVQMLNPMKKRYCRMIDLRQVLL